MKQSWPFLFAYLLPISVLYSFTLEGAVSFFPLVIYFGVLPLTELFWKQGKINSESAVSLKKNKSFQWIAMGCLPILIVTALIFFDTISTIEFNSLEYWSYSLNMGLMFGVIGINVGHELGHSNSKLESLTGSLLLLISWNSHFKPYHNHGHHVNVGTRKDPATARRNESLYIFWFRSHFGSYAQAWKLDREFMLIYSFLTLVLLFSIFFFTGTHGLIAYTIGAVFGIILLETVNYIEHYGLERKETEKRVKPKHSWNSNHPLGRLTLFNLSRHSDHHAKASKKYQVLQSIEQAPQLPTGYPGMMLLSFFPPIFFRLMHERIASQK